MGTRTNGVGVADQARCRSADNPWHVACEADQLPRLQNDRPMFPTLSRKLISGDRRLRRALRARLGSLLATGVDLATVKTRELDPRKPKRCVTELIPDFPEIEPDGFQAWRSGVDLMLTECYDDDLLAALADRYDSGSENLVVRFRETIALLKYLQLDPHLGHVCHTYRDSLRAGRRSRPVDLDVR